MYLNVYLHHIHLAPVRFLQVIDGGFEPRSGQPKTIKLVFVASLLSTQH